MQSATNASGHIEFLPSHPHEGAISVPGAEAGHARVIAIGTSTTTHHRFNIAIAFERTDSNRTVVDSSFHHFADYNFDPRLGYPSFVTERNEHTLMKNEQALADAKAYPQNIA